MAKKTKAETSSLHDKWMKRLADEDKAHKAWRQRAADADKAYIDYSEEANAPLFPVFKTTIDLIHGRIYGQPPKPDVRKRHPSSPQDQPNSSAPDTGAIGPPGAVGMQPQPAPNQPGAAAQPGMAAVQGGAGIGSGFPGQMGAGNAQVLAPPSGQYGAAGFVGPQPNDPGADDNTISMCLERSISYIIDTTLFDRDAHMAVNDFLVAGCGIAKVEMETEYEEIPAMQMSIGQDGMPAMVPMLDEEGMPLQLKQITYQMLHLRHFGHSQFHWEPCKDWRQCGWVAFDHYMTKEDIEDQFDVKISEATKDTTSSGESSDTVTGSRRPQLDKYKGTFTVHEIWDKDSKRRIWVSDCYPKELDVEDDPLELEDFFPCPAPMMTNVSGKELLPIPDYWSYESLVKQADEISERIREITKQVKDIAFYDSSFGELKKANEYKDGTFIAVNNLLDKLRSTNGKATAESIIYQVDMTAKVGVLKQLMEQLEWIKSRIYEINGIADIQRGVSNPNDTATAQKIKNDWADIRTGQRVQVVALFFRDIFRIMAQLISNKFAESQIEAMSGITLSENQIATIRSELASCYAVDVESDSTMVEDDSAAQEQVMQFTQAWTSYLTNMLPAVKHGIMPADLFKEGLLLIKDAYKSGRQLEQAINALPNTLQQLQDLTSTAEQAQQQAAQLQQQNQELQKQLAQHTQTRDAVDTMRAQSEAQAKQVHGQNESARVQIDAAKVQVDNAVKIAGVHQHAHDSALNHAQKQQQAAQKQQAPQRPQ